MGINFKTTDSQGDIANYQPTIAVVLPCYNVEDFVEEAINSLLNQESPATEVIMIDDGSIDATLSILKRYEHHPSCKVVSTKNHGLGSARNLGASMAKSDFLMFVDSDDYICTSLFSGFLQAYKLSPDIDIFAFSLAAFDNKSKISLPNYSHIYSKELVGNGKDVLSSLLINGDYHSSCCSIIVRRKLLNWVKHGFCHILHEDEEMKLRLFFLSSRVYITKNIYYYYRKSRDGSIMSSSGYRRFFLSRLGYIASLLSCLCLLMKSLEHKSLALSLFNYAAYLSRHAFLPLFFGPVSFLRKLIWEKH